MTKLDEPRIISPDQVKPGQLVRLVREEHDLKYDKPDYKDETTTIRKVTIRVAKVSHAGFHTENKVYHKNWTRIELLEEPTLPDGLYAWRAKDTLSHGLVTWEGGEITSNELKHRRKPSSFFGDEWIDRIEFVKVEFPERS